MIWGAVLFLSNLIMKFDQILASIENSQVETLLKALTEAEQKQLITILAETYLKDNEEVSVEEGGTEIFGNFDNFIFRILTPCPAL